MKILILGTTGMLGSTLFKYFSNSEIDVWGTVRNSVMLDFFTSIQRKKIILDVDITKQDNLVKLFKEVKPDIVINCIGIIKQQGNAKDPLTVLPINSMLPHRLSGLCELMNARLIHISTDCVFSGKKGMYIEEDISDAEDLYGKSKYIGEIHDKEHVFTIRTSIIGHELNSNYSLIDWFLSQQGIVNGYKKAIFSGFPTIELAHIIKEYILPNPNLYGLYHISTEPIDKYNLLQIVKKHYRKNINIIENQEVIIDRSLNSEKFRKVTGYVPPNWDELIQRMLRYKLDYMDRKNV
ncbi:MAG: SDR family oxidoreductase [Leptospiraceae bacterium]|nr:SDR family oxidoreductase [Leptospiraceae bacterium]